eukprot:2796785-Pyramimonas_sp.AAC.1
MRFRSPAARRPPAPPPSSSLLSLPVFLLHHPRSPLRSSWLPAYRLSLSLFLPLILPFRPLVLSPLRGVLLLPAARALAPGVARRLRISQGGRR